MATAHMAVRTETFPHSNPIPHSESMGARIIPIPTPTIKMSPPSNGDPMEITSPAPSSTGNNNSDSDANGKSNDRLKNSPAPDSNNVANNNANNSNSMPAPPPAAAAVHQPKIVQTAFIHKLYNMLEDPNIQHLISWSASAESFVMSPSADFSKVLSQYFKHTNISSFVRQLNMYGFHKERDVFHTGNPDTTLWEFKHGNGNFKRGDLVGLREIKRRASRHALVHRESNYTKPAASQPGTPAEPVPIPPDSADARLLNIEHTLFDLSNRLQRSEEAAHYMHVKSQAAMDTVNRLLHFNQELSRTMLSLVPAESPLSREVITLQGEMQRQAEVLRTLDEPPQEAPYTGRQQYFANVENAPVSPRQLAQDDQRRGPALGVPPARGQNFYKPPVPSNLSSSTRRPYGSISGSTDIRAHGWQPAPSPFSTGAPSGAWPPSPSRVAPEDQRIRDSFSTYSLQAASQTHPHSRPTTPPPPFANGAGGGSDTFGGWSWGSAGRENKNLAVKDHSAPPTRRGSMAHILNPSDTAERSDEDEDPRGDDDRKRKRMQ
ncbi:Heat shock factor (HSF)-type, DNA-binding [Fusarium oxysporum f. sp. vasinfectum]|nr:Heat shock factor (HSF)-type, DNA-binding [Fusarium oxysporum f. sp. vasinfectum]